MSDSQFTVAAALFEVGTTAMILLCVIAGYMRHKAVVVLGALTPAILVLAYLAYPQLTEPAPGNMASASWVMGFGAYVAILIGGIVLSFIPRPAHLPSRYLLGFALAPVLFGLLQIV
ncbi:hypothetical protein G4G28_00975 [Massilia sp. Dwa41.01b]|uniref:hypothetical protein n=1 Tax=unclassified Massilia TaxID=2609279 RepID=UPI0015FF69EC|nr:MULTISPECIES: hypothetical protein [unclassified Massilia]QNA87400.1 hypothetical protein G4G28_00975 [Massilia sp. Dwa41.01b]QNA98306.1 hypothetical protein G4G31_04735 [Massilia sp. Se16.2.3]